MTRAITFSSTAVFPAATVTKLRASDGRNLGTFSGANDPCGLVFDGVNIWESGLAYVAELRPSDCKVLFSIRTGDETAGIAFDGANVWVADFTKNGVHKF